MRDTLRDQFAAAALTGLLSNSTGLISANGMNRWSDFGCGFRHETAAEVAYELADAMLSKREARNGGCTSGLDPEADRKSVVSEKCRDTRGQPFDSAPITPFEKAVLATVSLYRLFEEGLGDSLDADALRDELDAVLPSLNESERRWSQRMSIALSPGPDVATKMGHQALKRLRDVTDSVCGVGSAVTAGGVNVFAWLDAIEREYHRVRLALAKQETLSKRLADEVDAKLERTPEAWAVINGPHPAVYMSRKFADGQAVRYGGTVVPLYRRAEDETMTAGGAAT